MQAEDDERHDDERGGERRDERRDLERALYARPDGSAETETRRREAARRLRSESEIAAADPQTGSAPELLSERPVAPIPPDTPPPEEPRRPRRRAALITAGALAAGLALGAAAASVALDRPSAEATATPTPTARPIDRFEDLVEGWEPTTDLPDGFDLVATGATVYTPGFETVQDDRLLLSAPNGTMLCLGLQRPDGTFSVGCTGLADFFDGNALRLAGSARGEDSPVFTRVQLNPDGTIEGGFQLVGEAAAGG
ncbi:hypothetical protein GRS96_01855 [Rathayibacter sp. VKM Ac-2803]|uniref:hypothetical protein n=1 Tax=unclassified Rathayibacter TaxID=2609250 RepID=UPI00135ADADA|nr:MULTISPECIES: hypothetical protein [unclassified Rathayibacter]MWV48017.1 hypothetical protein [Rathayibacter sp. VKM Ac-2803]MWV58759.1 hypothetical protein [Rathayibacter sp. VKM Ac-2754]